MSPHCPKNSIFVLAFKTPHKLVSIPFQPRVQQAYPCSASVTSSNCHFSCVQLFVAPWTVASKGPPSMGFSGEEYRVGFHALLQGIFSTLGLNLSLTSPALAGGFFTTCSTWEARALVHVVLIARNAAPSSFLLGKLVSQGPAQTSSTL